MSCSHEEIASSKTINSKQEKNEIFAKNNLPNGSVPTNYLDWENIDFMPTPPGYERIYVPWASGASTKINSNIFFDYRAFDGWSLVYSTFNTTNIEPHWFFILYNKFRGVIRMYYYVPSTISFVSSTYIANSLTVLGTNSASSPILNFHNQEIVDFNVKPTTASNQDPFLIGPGTWYASEYELAYDNTIASQNYLTQHLRWEIKGAQISELKVNGSVDLSDTMDGSVGTSGFNLTVSPNFNFSSTKYGNGSIIYKGSNDASSVTTNKIGQALISAITSGLKSGKASGVQSVINGIFSGIIVDSEKYTNINLSGTISLKGTISSNFLGASIDLAIPGSDQSQTVEFTPYYNDPLGLFYISAKPSVVQQKKYVSPYTWTVYTLNPNSFNLIFNPTLSSIATIRNIKKAIILGDANEARSLEVGGPADLIEFGNRKLYDADNIIWFRTVDGVQNLKTIWVRVTFDIVPNNGSRTIHIVKTFKPTIIISNTPYTGPLYK
jgi:hypothetical protein